MLFEYSLHTTHEGLFDITAQLEQAVAQSGIRSGLATVYCPHTTAAITINENADPAVASDIMLGLESAFPDRPDFRHLEGNSAAHLKSSAVGTSVSVIIESGRPLLGTWQAVYFCEFDPPRHRRFYISVIG